MAMIYPIPVKLFAVYHLCSPLQLGDIRILHIIYIICLAHLDVDCGHSSQFEIISIHWDGVQIAFPPFCISLDKNLGILIHILPKVFSHEPDLQWEIFGQTENKPLSESMVV